MGKKLEKSFSLQQVCLYYLHYSLLYSLTSTYKTMLQCDCSSTISHNFEDHPSLHCILIGDQYYILSSQTLIWIHHCCTSTLSTKIMLTGILINQGAGNLNIFIFMLFVNVDKVSPPYSAVIKS